MATGAEPTPSAGPGEERARPKRSPRENARLALAVVLAVFGTLFAVLNLDKVKVDWIVTTGRSPLIVVIVISFLLGVAVDRIAALRARRGARHRDG
jgi:uncharacterized integral membrane protein